MQYQSGKIVTIRAGHEELAQVSVLFNKYREFYGQKSDIQAATAFIRDRMLKNESVIFLALEETDEAKIPVGFVQLYPSFSSVSMKRLWILNDLYVDENKRRAGIGQQLIDQVKSFAVETEAKGVTLCTAIDNNSAQRLYEKTGFTKNEAFYYYYCYF